MNMVFGINNEIMEDIVREVEAKGITRNKVGMYPI